MRRQEMSRLTYAIYVLLVHWMKRRLKRWKKLAADWEEALNIANQIADTIAMCIIRHDRSNWIASERQRHQQESQLAALASRLSD